jgi:hypothetical protein
MATPLVAILNHSAADSGIPQRVQDLDELVLVFLESTAMISTADSLRNQSKH